MMKLLLILFSFSFIADPTFSRIDAVAEFSKSENCPSSHAILIDMSRPSTEKRLHVVDLETKKIIYSTYVAHGKGSGRGAMATKFSDVPGSFTTSLGKFKVGKCYNGKHGTSYELVGLESTNSNALSRAIVIHSAWYAEENFIKKSGRCGNSQGCPAVSPQALTKLKPYLQENVVVWIYR